MLKKIPLPTLEDGRKGAADFTWYHLATPTADEILECSRRWKFPADFLSAVLDPDEIARGSGLRQEALESPVLIALLYPVNQGTQDIRGDNGGHPKESVITAGGTYSTRLLSIVWLPGVLLTCSGDEMNFSEILGKRRKSDYPEDEGLARRDLERLEPAMNLDKPEKVIAALIWEISQQYIRATRVLNSRTRRIQQLIAHTAKTELLMAVSQIEESLVMFETSLEQNHPIIEGMREFGPFLSDREQESWLVDILTEGRQAEQMVYRASRTLEQLNQTFSSVIDNNLNITMKVLTSITILLTIPTIIGGFWGMNVPVPMEKLNPAFWLLVGVSLVLSFAVAYFLKRKDLL